MFALRLQVVLHPAVQAMFYVLLKPAMIWDTADLQKKLHRT